MVFQGLSPVVLEALRDLSTESAAVSRADQRAMKRAVSVSFVKARSKVNELATAHKAALDAFKEKKDTPDDDLASLASSHKSSIES
jgi:hypothetical protein